jgi:RNA polymerase sigma factor (sigma-70 family)
MSEELFHKYKQDKDRRSYQRLFEQHLPLVGSVCRRFLRDPEDVQDAIQETFLKLAGNLDSVNGTIGAWLSVTARTTSVDLIRRSIRDRNGRHALAHAGRRQVEYLARREAIRARLHEGMALIDPQSKDLLADRFVRKVPLGVLAVKLRTSVPTACRRVADAVRELARVLRDLGVDAADDHALADHFNGGQTPSGHDDVGGCGLRFAADWHDAALTPLGSGHAYEFMPGSTRLLRVGVLISYETTVTAGMNNNYIGAKWQVHSRAFFPGVGLQLVGVIEPGTAHRGIVEASLRDYEVVGGLIEADDPNALATLDVLLLGNNYAMSPSIARAISRAVRGGVGLLNEYWTSGQVGIADNPDTRALMLADSPVCSYHMPGACGEALSANVLREHRLLPGLRDGQSISVRGCGPVYRVAPTAQVLMEKSRDVLPHEHRIAGMGPTRMPCYILGQLGRGRVAVVHAWPHQWLARQLSVPVDQYYSNLLLWLAGAC